MSIFTKNSSNSRGRTPKFQSCFPLPCRTHVSHGPFNILSTTHLLGKADAMSRTRTVTNPRKRKDAAVPVQMGRDGRDAATGILII